jgi:ABC-2 type transport system ATP-binding protein
VTDHHQAVEVRDLTVQFGRFTAVDRISFSVSRGEIFGFLGANGAGKTTTIRVLCGLLLPTSGSARVVGIDVREGERAVKSKVGYMSQKFTLYNDLTVEENLNFIAALRRVDPQTYIQRRAELFKFISFDRPLTTIVQDLPGGIKQQVALAGSLLHDPEIVFLDEPTAGVSPSARSLFWSLIRDLASQGKTVFVTTHYMDEAEQCERIALMRDGKIIALDTPNGLKASTFPTPVYEFNPKVKLSFAEISALEQSDVFSFFEPYGLRFHASVRSESQWEKERARFEERFHIQRIEPSLEDVFIRSVERGKA